MYIYTAKRGPNDCLEHIRVSIYAKPDNPAVSLNLNTAAPLHNNRCARSINYLIELWYLHIKLGRIEYLQAVVVERNVDHLRHRET